MVKRVFLVTLLISTPAVAQESVYRPAYEELGFVMRYVGACQPKDWKRLVERAADLVTPYKAFSEAYPQTITEWGAAGAGTFNDGVMRHGLPASCRSARSIILSRFNLR